MRCLSSGQEADARPEFRPTDQASRGAFRLSFERGSRNVAALPRTEEPLRGWLGVFVLVYVSGGDRLLMRAASLSLDGMCRSLRCLKSGQEACARPEFRPAPTLPDACADAATRDGDAPARNEHQLAARYSGSSGLSRRVSGVHLTWWRVRRAPAHASARVWEARDTAYGEFAVSAD